MSNLKLKDLEKEKENITNDKLKNAEVELNINFEKRLEELENSLVLEKLKLTEDRIKNSDIVGEIMTNIFPVKPKKSLIVVVAFLTGFIISIFLVFLFNFIKQSRSKIN
ncbi:GNVR domain-containing protein [Aliarcobacter trophiarum]|uniref:GNVR domain-containing protein n=1 Tax=Aliarcobacter trophiarum TaxID=708186 RepID=UPI0013E95377|nr:GNVR domain-containing protein [Aliarcobacter trophiarum]